MAGCTGAPVLEQVGGSRGRSPGWRVDGPTWPRWRSPAPPGTNAVLELFHYDLVRPRRLRSPSQGARSSPDRASPDAQGLRPQLPASSQQGIQPLGRRESKSATHASATGADRPVTATRGWYAAPDDAEAERADAPQRQSSLTALSTVRHLMRRCDVGAVYRHPGRRSDPTHGQHTTKSGRTLGPHSELPDSPVASS